jgi:hypothetical protein
MSSSFLKTQLKTAREAIANKNFEYAEGLCRDILENDSTNYNVTMGDEMPLSYTGTLI